MKHQCSCSLVSTDVKIVGQDDFEFKRMNIAAHLCSHSTKHSYIQTPVTLTESERLEGLKPHAVICGLVLKLEGIQMQQQRISAETLAFIDVLPTL